MAVGRPATSEELRDFAGELVAHMIVVVDFDGTGGGGRFGSTLELVAGA